MAAFAKCQQAIEREVRNMQAIHSMSGLFVAMDTRKHGSRGLRILGNRSSSAYLDSVLLDTITRKMFDALRPYGNAIETVEEWEASFDNISSISAPTRALVHPLPSSQSPRTCYKYKTSLHNYYLILQCKFLPLKQPFQYAVHQT